jgi:ribosomal protein S18 acetylase RimI-like enzyme
MIRPARPDDFDAVMGIADASGLFRPDELEAVGGILASHFAGELGEDHHWMLVDEDGPSAVTYYAPEAFADGVWNLYLLAVDPARQGGGRGATLVRSTEAALAARGARILLIETSSVERFARTRQFYRTCGYVEEARIREYYGPGDDKIVFWKRLAA